MFVSPLSIVYRMSDRKERWGDREISGWETQRGDCLWEAGDRIEEL